MKILVLEKVRGDALSGGNRQEFAKLAGEDLAYKLKLEREGKIIAGGPYLDIIADCYILQVDTMEEMGEIFFNSPSNLVVDREIHPLGTFADSLEGMHEIAS
jgi:hypothetical protein